MNIREDEVPTRYFTENLEYLGMTEDELYEAIDAFRQPHLWDKIDGQRKLKKQVS